MTLISCIKSVTFALLGSMTCASLQAQTLGCPAPKRPVHIYYSNPVTGSMNGDGSQARPWGKLADIISAGLVNGQDNASGAVHAGDLIYLFNGNHGDVVINQYYGSGKYTNTDFITIQAAPGNVPVLKSLFCSGSKWVFRGLTISQTAPPDSRYFELVKFSGCNNILFDKNTVCSQADVSNWTPTDWGTLCVFEGIDFDGTSSTISNNIVKNVENGIGFNGSFNVLKSNVIDCFANDGIDFTVTDSVMQYNTVTNHYGQWHDDGFHHDGMQGWTVGNATSSNVLIDSNIVMASTGIYPFIPPLPTNTGDDYLQGLSIFSGIWENVTVTNNVVAACAFHGIGMYGISNSVVANNTVIKQTSDQNLRTWLGVFADSGVPVSNVIVRNNIANTYQLTAGAGLTDDHNISLSTYNIWSYATSDIVVSDPTKIFVKYQPSTAGFDFRLIQGSPAIGTGIPQNAPLLDILGLVRNPASFDIGAYKYVAN